MIVPIIAFILILAFLVLVHELGHFFAAKKSGIAVEEFGLGFPPTIFKKKIGETHYSLNAIPLGGYVKIKGEDGEHNEEQDSFGAQPIWQRIIVICAGVLMNIVAGWLLLVILFMVGAPLELDDSIPSHYVKHREIVITDVLEDTPAATSGLLPGDVLLSIDEINMNKIALFQDYISNLEGKATTIVYERGGVEETIALAPEILQQITNHPIIGVALSEVGVVRFPIHKAFVAGTQSAVNYLDRILSAFGSIVAQVWKGDGLGNSLGGPVAIAVATSDVLDLGFSHVVIFTAVLSFNLAIINILPFPALDGGRLIFLAVEAIRRKPSRQEVEAWFHRVGFVLLMVLAIVITYKDLVRFGGRIWEAVLG
jgi:regulator of sigma E protease